MEPYRYHEGQRAIQREANSVACADKLSTWVGPVADFARLADLVVLTRVKDGAQRVGALSGSAPLVGARGDGPEIELAFPSTITALFPAGERLSGIVINPALARRSRFGGVLREEDGAPHLDCGIAFTNCRKYMTPTSSVPAAPHFGPTAEEPLPPDAPWVVRMIEQGETAFLLSASPEGLADASHRGGPPGFLHYDPATATLGWTEYLGDGMFVSAGHIRATGRFSLVVLDFATGDALRLDTEGDYTNIRADRRERVDALIQAEEPFPVQGRMTARVRRATRLTAFCLPRVRVEGRQRITSVESTKEQHP